MIHNLIIATESGVKLFDKQFMMPVANGANLLASLLTAVLVKGKKELFHTIEYVEMENLALTLVNDGLRKLFCAIITDSDVGFEFSKLIASQTLQKYIEETCKSMERVNNRNSSNDLLAKSASIVVPTTPKNSTIATPTKGLVGDALHGQRIFPSLTKYWMRDFSFSRMKFNGLPLEEEKTEEFNYRIDPEVFQSKLRDTFLSIINPILYEVRREIGIISAELISKDQDVLRSTSQSLDLRAFSDFLMSNSTDILNAVNDNPKSLEISFANGRIVNIVQVENNCNLVVVYSSPYCNKHTLLLDMSDEILSPDIYVENIRSVITWAVSLLRKVQELQKMTY
ncbi:hypothetical protein ABK040_013705 [Willaertia magna]